MDIVRQNINAKFGTEYTVDNFIGTNFYKYFYTLVQRLQESEVKTSEIFIKLQEYITQTNLRISRPVCTNPGLVEKFATLGFTASVKPMVDADAGKSSICVDVVDNHARGNITITNYANLVSGTHDTVTVGATVFTAQSTSVTPGDGTFQAATSNAATADSLAAQINAHATAGALVYAWAYGAIVYIRALAGGTAGNSIALDYTDHDSNVGATKSDTTLSGGDAVDAEDEYDDVRETIADIIKDSVAAGVVTQGTEVVSKSLTNGQSFDFKFFLPSRPTTYLKLTTILSENNEEVIKTPEEVKAILLANIAEKYKLGKDFEPQKYFSVADAPWAGSVLLEYSFDNSSWVSTIRETAFNELLTFSLAHTTLVES